MKTKYNSIWLIIYAFALAVLFIFVNGYSFNTGDQAEHLPQVYQRINPSLYPNDFFINSVNKTYDIRSPYVVLVYNLQKIIPLEYVCFLGTLIFSTIAVYACMRLVQALYRGFVGALLAPVLILFVGIKATIGGNQVLDPIFISGTIAQPLALWGLAEFLHKRYNISAILLGLSSIFQILVGGQLFLILSLILIWQKNSFSQILKFFLVFGIITGPAGLPIIYQQFISESSFSSIEKNQALDILFGFRCQLHYLPSLFPLKDYIRTFFLWGLAISTLSIVSIHQRKTILQFFSISLLGLLAYTIGLELLGINVIGKIQWFKVTMWLQALSGGLCAVGIAKFLYDCWERWIRFSVISLAVLALVIIFIRPNLNISFLPEHQIGNYARTDLQKMHQWIEKNLPLEAVILYAPDNYAFPCEAKRNSIVGYKAMIFETSYILEWYKRYKYFFKVDKENLANRSTLRLAAENYEKYYIPSTAQLPYHYRINHLKHCTYRNQLGKVIHQVGDYILTTAQ